MKILVVTSSALTNGNILLARHYAPGAEAIRVKKAEAALKKATTQLDNAKKRQDEAKIRTDALEASGKIRVLVDDGETPGSRRRPL